MEEQIELEPKEMLVLTLCSLSLVSTGTRPQIILEITMLLVVYGKCIYVIYCRVLLCLSVYVSDSVYLPGELAGVQGPNCCPI